AGLEAKAWALREQRQAGAGLFSRHPTSRRQRLARSVTLSLGELGGINLCKRQLANRALSDYAVLLWAVLVKSDGGTRLRQYVVIADEVFRLHFFHEDRPVHVDHL